MIAMALISSPALLIADEPTTALDVTTQAQILDLIKELQAETGMAVLLITHDLGVVANVADEVVVMYRGRVMEAGTREDIFRRAQHPYLQALMRAVPRFAMAAGERLTPIREVKSTVAGRARATARPRATPTGPILRGRGSHARPSRCDPDGSAGKVAHHSRGQRRQPCSCRAARRSGSSASPAAARPRVSQDHHARDERRHRPRAVRRRHAGRTTWSRSRATR